MLYRYIKMQRNWAKYIVVIWAKYIATIRSTTCKLQRKQRFQSEKKKERGGGGGGVREERG